jgi:hypothetical protein
VVGGAGPPTVVSAGSCRLVLADGRTVDTSSVLAALSDALDRQRDRFVYPPVRDGRLGCEDPGTTGPFRPGRDRIEAAVACTSVDGGPTTTPLSGESLDRLRAAWAATPPPVDHGSEAGCASSGRLLRNEPFVLVRTTIGDVVRLDDTDCDPTGTISATATDPERLWEVPIALDDLIH